MCVVSQSKIIKDNDGRFDESFDGGEVLASNAVRCNLFKQDINR